jgi:hypothetical protein
MGMFDNFNWKVWVAISFIILVYVLMSEGFYFLGGLLLFPAFMSIAYLFLKFLPKTSQTISNWYHKERTYTFTIKQLNEAQYKYFMVAIGIFIIYLIIKSIF